MESLWLWQELNLGAQREEQFGRSPKKVFSILKREDKWIASLNMVLSPVPIANKDIYERLITTKEHSKLLKEALFGHVSHLLHHHRIHSMSRAHNGIEAYEHGIHPKPHSLA